MVKCELCGKVVQTTQGLRGHKTFVHGLHANHDNPAAELTFRQRIDKNRSLVKAESSSISDYRDRLDKLKSEVVSNTELLTELRRIVSNLQNRLAVMDTRSETNSLATKIELLSKDVEKHDHWLNPESTDEMMLEICGGPIGSLEKRIDNLSSSQQIKNSG